MDVCLNILIGWIVGLIFLIVFLACLAHFSFFNFIRGTVIIGVSEFIIQIGLARLLVKLILVHLGFALLSRQAELAFIRHV